MIEHDRLITDQTNVAEEALDRAIRPTSLDDYMGQ